MACVFISEGVDHAPRGAIQIESLTDVHDLLVPEDLGVEVEEEIDILEVLVDKGHGVHNGFGVDLGVHRETDVDLGVHKETDVNLRVHKETVVNLGVHKETVVNLGVHKETDVDL